MKPENYIESIRISDINMNLCYFNPGCALSIYKPEAEHKLLELLNKSFGTVQMHNICCHHEPSLPKGSTIINNCSGCDRRFRSLYDGIVTVTIWEVLDSIESLELPDHTGLTLSVHDSCSFRHKPQVHEAVRSLLCKMNISIIESEFCKTSSICCGDNLYPHVSIEEVTAFQKKRAAQMPCEDVAVYCVSCINSMAVGKKIPHHMVDLVLNEKTEPMETRIDLYHDALHKYIDAH